MAGEKKGKTYEALVWLASEQLRAEGKLKGQVFSNQTPKGKRVATRPAVRMLILVVGGIRRQSELDALASSGWGEIFYPDQLGNLQEAVV